MNGAVTEQGVVDDKNLQDRFLAQVMAAAGTGLVARFSSTANLALFVIVTFSFFTVIKGYCGKVCDIEPELVCCSGRCLRGFSCFGRSCSRDSDCSRSQSCCGKKCAYGSSCLYEQCSTDADCSVNQACCRSLCLKGKSCLGQWCSIDSDCSFNQLCCDRKCVQGKTSCLGQKCTVDDNCSEGETCCQGTCKKGHCPLISTADLPPILAVTVGVIAFSIVCAILVYRCRKRRRLLMAANTPTNLITTNTNVSTVSVTQCNPLYQPEGPPSDQPTVQPPPYTATPTEGADGMYAPQTDSLFASGQSKTEGAV